MPGQQATHCSATAVHLAKLIKLPDIHARHASAPLPCGCLQTRFGKIDLLQDQMLSRTLQVVGGQDNMGSGVQCQQESCPAGKATHTMLSAEFHLCTCTFKQSLGHGHRCHYQGLRTLTSLQAAAFTGPEQEAAFQALCRWCAALGYIMKAHLEGIGGIDEAGRVRGARHTVAAFSCQHLIL